MACQDDMIAETKAVSDDSNHDDEDNNYMNLDKEDDGDENLFLDDFRMIRNYLVSFFVCQQIFHSYPGLNFLCKF